MYIESVGSEVRRRKSELDFHPVVQGCLVTCRRCSELAATIGPEAFARRSRQGHSIGEHLRHCAEHFLCFFRDLASGVVDYDARDRNPRLERDADFLVGVMDEISSDLAHLDRGSLDKPIYLRALACPETEPVLHRSSIERELLFLSSHNVHHLALALSVAGELGLDLPPEIGLAFSTAAHRARLG